MAQRALEVRNRAQRTLTRAQLTLTLTLPLTLEVMNRAQRGVDRLGLTVPPQPPGLVPSPSP